MPLDPNLEKIRDHNLRLIRRGKLALPIIHAKSYLFNILGEEAREDIETELKEYVDHIKALVPDPPESPNTKRRRPHREKKAIHNRGRI